MSQSCPYCRDDYVQATMHGEGFSGPMPCPDCGGTGFCKCGNPADMGFQSGKHWATPICRECMKKERSERR